MSSLTCNEETGADLRETPHPVRTKGAKVKPKIDRPQKGECSGLQEKALDLGWKWRL